jgi:hypothetical protein
MTGRIQTHRGTISAIPDGATAVALNLTAVSPSHAGYLSVKPAGSAVVSTAPNTSNLNFRAGYTVPNLVISGLSARGQIEVTYGPGRTDRAGTDVVIDVMGYFVPSAGSAVGPTGPAGPEGPAGPPGAPGIGAEGGPEVLSVRLKLGPGIETSLERGVVEALFAAQGQYFVTFERVVSECLWSVSLLSEPGSSSSARSVTAEVAVNLEVPSAPEPGSRIRLRLWDGAGAIAETQSGDVIDLLVFCLNDE